MVLVPEDASERLRRHFSEVSPEEFTENVQRYCPEVDEASWSTTSVQTQDGEAMNQLVLLQPEPSPLPLEAYLASALTGLNSEQKQLVFQLSDVISTICASHDIQLYEPRKRTDPVHHAEVPDAEVFKIDRERVMSTDLLIHLCHYPSTGAGEELDFAYNALVPMILVCQNETRVSRMITGIPSFKIRIEYSEPEELRQDLHRCLTQIRPILEQRKLAFSRYDVNIVGEKIRLLREGLGLTREEVAENAPHLTLDSLRHLEESTDRVSNPTLIRLREVATILKTTVADLVEPDLSERLLGTLEEWTEGRQAARFPGMSARDRNRLVRRILLRVIDSLEDD